MSARSPGVRKLKGRVIEVKPREVEMGVESADARGLLRRSVKAARESGRAAPRSGREAKVERWKAGAAHAQKRAADLGLSGVAGVKKPAWKAKAKEQSGNPYGMTSSNAGGTTRPVQKSKKGTVVEPLYLKQREWKRAAAARKQGDDPYADPAMLKRKRNEEARQQEQEMARWQEMKKEEDFIKNRIEQNSAFGGLPMPSVMRATNKSMQARTQQEAKEAKRQAKEKERARAEKQRLKEEKWAAKAKAKADFRLAANADGAGRGCHIM